MEKLQSDKIAATFSFIRNGSKRNDNAGEDAGKKQNAVVEEDILPERSIDQVIEEVDQFLEELSNATDKEGLPEPPIAAVALPRKVEIMIAKYEAGGGFPNKFGHNDEDDRSFVEAVKRLTTMNERLGEFGFDGSACYNRTGTGLQKSMAFLEGELHVLLEDYKGNHPNPTKKKNSSSHEAERSANQTADHDESAGGLSDFPGYSESAVSTMNKIATLMISAGYEAECTMAYHVSRRQALKSAVTRIGFYNMSIEDVVRTAWDILESEITDWIGFVKTSATVLFPSERMLCESVFSDYPAVYRREYTRLAKNIITRLLTFAEAAAQTKRSTEKLFKFLDMYESFLTLTPAIEGSDLDSSASVDEIQAEIADVQARLAETVVSIFIDLEHSIRNDKGRTPMPSGAVHPSTRYTMNYLKYACEYKDTLEQVFKHHHHFTKPSPAGTTEGHPNEDGTPKSSPFANQLVKVMEALDENLDLKSKLYRDVALRFVFLMNNGRYILQKIKGSSEIHEIVGDNCYRRRSSAVRQHHKSYTRETWGRLLQNLRQEGLTGSNGSKICKTVLKERLKSFNASLEEIHKTQSAWVVSDEQLQSELRASVSAVVIPAYRSFLARFKQHLDPGKQTQKYVKYQPEEIENLVEELFDGTASSIGRKRN